MLLEEMLAHMMGPEMLLDEVLAHMMAIAVVRRDHCWKRSQSGLYDSCYHS
jgi:hypothetical protein